MDKKIFITGELAYNSLTKVISNMKPDFEYSVLKLDITVAALMDTRFVIRGLQEKAGNQIIFEDENHYQIILPGRCQLDLEMLEEEFSGIKFVQGPKELLKIPEFFGYEPKAVDIKQINRDSKIIAEITEAPLLTVEEMISRAKYYHQHGADVIDLGSMPGVEFSHLEAVIDELKNLDYQVSIDTLEAEEINRANSAGVDLVLSLNSSNLGAVEVGNFKPVVIPDRNGGLSSLKQNVRMVREKGFEDYIIDPILDPVNFGFSSSLNRFYRIRQLCEGQQILMGIGNLLELTDTDTTGINTVMAGFIGELKLDYVLTTEASPRTRNAVRELDLALRLMNYTARRSILPNNITDRLITVKDQKPDNFSREEIQQIAKKVTDSNYRIMIDGSKIYIFNNQQFISGLSIENIFEELNIKDPSHAFYLGRELNKAKTALSLGKEYNQEEELNWGYLNENRGGNQ